MIRALIFDLDDTLVQIERLGGARNEVAMALMQRFILDVPAQAQLAELGLDHPWQVFLRIRQHFYDDILADDGLLKRSVYQHNLDLLRSVRASGYKTGLATQRVLEAIGARELLDVYVACEDVERGKPDPEIYVLAARLLAVEPKHSLVIEDSPNGARAALRAGMNVIVVTTPFTRQKFAHENIADRRWVVDDPGDLRGVVQEALTML